MFMYLYFEILYFLVFLN